MSGRDQLIIESPGLQRPLPRTAWALATALFWAAWFWLWLPLLSIVGWAFGIYTAYDQFVLRWGYIELLRLLPYYIVVIGTTGLTLIGWSLVQYHRFHGKERRKAFPVSTRADVAKYLGLDEATTVPWVDARRMVAYHDENGRVSWVEIASVPTEPAVEESRPTTVTSPSLPTVEAPQVLAMAANEGEVTQSGIEPPEQDVAPTPRKRAAQLLNFTRERKVIAPLIVPQNDQADAHSNARSAMNHSVNDQATMQLSLIDEATSNAAIAIKNGTKNQNSDKLVFGENMASIQFNGSKSDIAEIAPVDELDGTNDLASPKKRTRRRSAPAKQPLESSDATVRLIDAGDPAQEQLVTKQLPSVKPRNIKRSSSSKSKTKSTADAPKRKEIRAIEDIANSATGVLPVATMTPATRKRTRKPRAAE